MITFLSTCFYILGIIFIIFEMAVFADKGKLADHARDPEIGEPILWTMFAYEVWVVIGLFSTQYVYFIVLLIFSLMPKTNRMFSKIDNILSIAAIVAIIIAKYH